MGSNRADVPAHQPVPGAQEPDGASRLDRRTVLAVAGGAMVAGIGGAAPLASPAMADEAPGGAQRIDAHTHFSSLKYLDALEKQDGKPFVLGARYRKRAALTDVKARIDLLDRNNVDMHVLVPIPWLEAFPAVASDRAAAPLMARVINDEIAEVVARAPKRFRGVAVLPTVDPDAMIAELDRAVKELGFLGAYVAVGPTAKPMDHPDFEHLYRRIVELDATLWMHPSRPPLPEQADEKVSKFGEWLDIGWPYDTTTAMYRIVFSGVFERHPAIRILTHHHGGFLPYYAGRMQGLWEDDEPGAGPQTTIAKSYMEHFKKFYCDTACNEAVPKVLELALDFFGPDRVLFGSDVPFGAQGGDRFAREVPRAVEGMQISPQVRAAIFSGNARRVLKIV
jgi:predicted TIM-barrel fold metal-dependent hydrolase